MYATVGSKEEGEHYALFSTCYTVLQIYKEQHEILLLQSAQPPGSSMLLW